METIETRGDGVVVLSVRGRIDAANAGSFEQRVLGLIDAGERRLVLDLADLDYVNSAGLRVLLITAKRIAAANGKLALAGLGSRSARSSRSPAFRSSCESLRPVRTRSPRSDPPTLQT